MSIKAVLLMTGFWLVFMSSALAVVYMTHESRLATQQLELLKNEEADLHVQAGQLLLERSTLSAFVRVEQLASEKLGMSVPKTEDVVIVSP